MASSELEVKFLQDIREAIGQINHRLDSAIRRVGGAESTILQHLDRVESMVTQRLGAVEVSLRALAEEQRSLVRYFEDLYFAG